MPERRRPRRIPRRASTERPCGSSSGRAPRSSRRSSGGGKGRRPGMPNRWKSAAVRSRAPIARGPSRIRKTRRRALPEAAPGTAPSPLRDERRVSRKRGSSRRGAEASAERIRRGRPPRGRFPGVGGRPRRRREPEPRRGAIPAPTPARGGKSPRNRRAASRRPAIPPSARTETSGAPISRSSPRVRTACSRASARASARGRPSACRRRRIGTRGATPTRAGSPRPGRPIRGTERFPRSSRPASAAP